MWLALDNLNARVVRGTDDEKRWLSEYLMFSDAKGRFSGRDGKNRMYNIMADSFPAGLLALVQTAAKREGLPVEVIDERAPAPVVDRGADLDWLREYQWQAVDLAVKHERGIVWAPTGAGKTEIAAALALYVPAFWLFVVHRTGLMQQAAARYELRTGLRAGRVGDGAWDVPDDATFVSCSFATLTAGLRSSSPEVRRKTIALLHRAGGVLVDEAHTLPSETFWAVVQSMPNARYRVGFSGTPLARGDRKSALAIAALGPVFYRITASHLIEAGVLSKPTINMYPCAQRSEEPTWAGVYGKAIVRSPVRNALLVKLAALATKPAFLFVKDTKHGRTLEKALWKEGIKCRFVFGKRDQSQRDQAVKDMERGALDVIVCSVVFQEGIDVPWLRSVINGAAGASVIATIQRIGRGMRVERDASGTVIKNAFEVHDIEDLGCGCRTDSDAGRHAGCRWLERHSRERMKACMAEGYEVLRKPAPLLLGKGESLG